MDLVPFKVCPYDCAYCQLGPTRHISVTREDFFPVPELVGQVARRLERNARPDVITLAGSGEPTLYRDLGALIAALKEITSVPVVLLTNGALLGDPKVREDAALANFVLPSLDAGGEATFRRVNRPHPSLTLGGVVAGLRAFRDRYEGILCLEVMVVGGVNDSDAEQHRISQRVREIRPDRIHLNTPVRPCALGAAAVVPSGRLEQIRGFYGPRAEVVAEYERRPETALPGGDVLEARIEALLARRPCTVEDAAAGLAEAPNAVAKAMGELVARGAVRREFAGGRLFFVAVPAEALP